MPEKTEIFSVSVHLWRYEGGYPALNEVMSKLRQNKVKNTDFVTQKRAKNRQNDLKKADLDTKVSHPFLYKPRKLLEQGFIVTLMFHS